jgi:excisionase family DNA binding protein
MGDMDGTTPLKLDRLAHDLPMGITAVAEYLDVTARTIDRWIREEGLPVHRLGSGPQARKRFYRSEIDEWVRSRCSDNTPRNGGRA